MTTKVLAVRVTPAVYTEFERVAAIGGMTITEGLKNALELYLQLDDAERLRRFRGGTLEQLAMLSDELRRIGRLLGSKPESARAFSGAEGAALVAALKAVEAAAGRITP